MESSVTLFQARALFWLFGGTLQLNILCVLFFPHIQSVFGMLIILLFLVS
jgi:hypothetical protein